MGRPRRSNSCGRSSIRSCACIPETGRKNLFVNPQFTVGLKGFDGPQASALLKMLYDHMTQYQFIVRYRWQPGSLAFWDNRTTMHYGIYDYGDDRRVMHRVTLKGERPFGVECNPFRRARIDVERVIRCTPTRRRPAALAGSAAVRGL